VSVSQLEKAMANLRIGLAEMENKEAQLDAQISQFRQQLRRVPRQAMYGQASLDASLAAMGEIEERLADAEAVLRRLLQIKASVTQELESLVLLKQVDEARTTLADLKRRGEVDEETATEIRRLEVFIAEGSKRAEQAITARYEERG
jgi:predicted  nucleic acid-binding Zn-ribbon protein